MKNTLETRLGIFVALALIAAFLVLEMIGGFDYFKRGYRLTAVFNTVQELKVGDPVKIAGVNVGSVESIGLTDDGKARITMKMKNDVQVKTDSEASVKFTGLMGQNFVALTSGKPDSPVATDGLQLQSVEQPDLSVLMAKLDNVATGVENLTKSFTGEKIDNLLGPFTDFLKQNSPRLSGILVNMQAVSDQVASGRGTVGKMIYEDEFYNSAVAAVGNLQKAGEEVQTTIAQARGIMDEINAGRGTLGKLATDDALYKETTTSMTQLREILQKINQGQGSVGALVNDRTFYKNANLTLQKVEKATEGLEDQGPLSVLGIAVNNLF